LKCFEPQRESAKSWDPEGETTIWFRGVTSKNFQLRPKAYWVNDGREKEDFYNEFQPILELCQEGQRFAENVEHNSWETYYFAQHGCHYFLLHS
jgi:hypothetical protein